MKYLLLLMVLNFTGCAVVGAVAQGMQAAGNGINNGKRQQTTNCQSVVNGDLINTYCR
jgi:hypothetical protein